MKKLLAILISIFLAVSFTGCNQDDDESKQTETVTGTQGETKPAEGENTSQEETKPTESETISLADTYWSSANTVITDETGLTTVTIEEQMYFCFRSLLFFWYDVEKNDYQNALESLPSELKNSEKTFASKNLSHSRYDSGRYTIEGRTIKFSKSSYSNAVELTLSEDLQSFVLTETYNGQSYKITFNRIESSPANAVVTMTLNPTDDTSEIAGYWVLEDIVEEAEGLKITMQTPSYITCDKKDGTMYTFDGDEFEKEWKAYLSNAIVTETLEDKTVNIPYSTETDTFSYFKIGSKITIASMDSEGKISYMTGTLSEDQKSITFKDETDETDKMTFTKVETVPENAKLTIEVLPTSSEPAADTSPSLNISSMNLNLLGKGK